MSYQHTIHQNRTVSNSKELVRKKGSTVLRISDKEKVMCSMLEGLIKMLSNTFRLQFNETIKSLQFCKLSRQDEASAGEWIGRFSLSAVECNYQELNRQL